MNPEVNYLLLRTGSISCSGWHLDIKFYFFAKQLFKSDIVECNPPAKNEWGALAFLHKDGCRLMASMFYNGYDRFCQYVRALSIIHTYGQL